MRREYFTSKASSLNMLSALYGRWAKIQQEFHPRQYVAALRSPLGAFRFLATLLFFGDYVTSLLFKL
jgi:hypothetical protein